jgi:DNA-binding CsgD family transcriptional regulator
MAASFAATIDALRAPVLLVGPGLRLVHANPAAQDLLDRGGLASVRGSALRLASPIADAALSAAIARACADESTMARTGLGIPVRAADGSLCALHVLPLASGALRGTLAPRAAAAVFIASAGRARGEVGALLAPLLNLTPAEVRVFDLITAGHTVETVAVLLGVAVRTVRTHLGRLFEKTGVTRQAELVRMAALLSHPE